MNLKLLFGLCMLFLVGCAVTECPECVCEQCKVTDCSAAVNEEAGKCTSRMADLARMQEEEQVYEESCIKKPNAKQQKLARDEIMGSVCYIYAPLDMPDDEPGIKYSIVKGVNMDVVCNEKGSGEIIIRIVKNGKQFKYLKTDVEVVEHLNVKCGRIISFND